MPAQHRAVNRTGDQAGNPAGNPEPAPEAQSSASLSLRPPMNASCDSSDALCVVPAAWCLLRSAASAAYYVVPAVLRLCGECCVLRAACCVLRVRAAYCVPRGAWCGFGLGLALLSQIASTCPQQSDRQANAVGDGATYTDMCALVKLASN